MDKVQIEISGAIVELEDLFRECDHKKLANWLKSKLSKLISANNDQTQYKEIIKEISGKLGGMGSFSDLSMVPGAKSNLNEEQASYMQWDIIERLSEAIEKALKKDV